jgi:GNAT superfamily N-acetyltransferase
MIVRPAGRGRGAGRLLLSRLERFAAGRGYPRAWVATGSLGAGFTGGAAGRRPSGFRTRGVSR